MAFRRDGTGLLWRSGGPIRGRPSLRPAPSGQLRRVDGPPLLPGRLLKEVRDPQRPLHGRRK